MKRVMILLVALGLLVAFAAPAGAAKPDNPGKPEPELVEVTLTGDLDTTLCPGTLIMEMDNRGTLFTGQTGPSVPRIFITAAIPWERDLPEYASGDFFNECHGGAVDDSPVEWNGSLWITPTDGGLEVLWLFDHYWEKVPKNPNKPDGPTRNLIENFRLIGEASDLDGDGIYGGDFTIGLHGEEPSGSDILEFTITTEPMP